MIPHFPDIAMLEHFFAFYREPELNDPASWFGHVDMFGPTLDETWVFINPDRRMMSVQVTHHAEHVNTLIAWRMEKAHTILKFDTRPLQRSAPPLMPMTCAAICGHTIGVRAFTTWGLKRSLLKNGATVWHENPKRRSSNRETA